MINCMFYKFDDLKSERINEMRNNLSRCNNKMIRKILHQNFQSNCHQFTSSRTYCMYRPGVKEWLRGSKS